MKNLLWKFFATLKRKLFSSDIPNIMAQDMFILVIITFNRTLRACKSWYIHAKSQILDAGKLRLLKPYLVSSERLLHPYIVWKHKLCVNGLQYYIDADLVMTCIAYLTGVVTNTVFIKIKSVHFSSIWVWTCLSTFIVKTDSRNILSQMTRAIGTQ